MQYADDGADDPLSEVDPGDASSGADFPQSLYSSAIIPPRALPRDSSGALPDRSFDPLAPDDQTTSAGLDSLSLDVSPDGTQPVLEHPHSSTSDSVSRDGVLSSATSGSSLQMNYDYQDVEAFIQSLREDVPFLPSDEVPALPPYDLSSDLAPLSAGTDSLLLYPAAVGSFTPLSRGDSGPLSFSSAASGEAKEGGEWEAEEEEVVASPVHSQALPPGTVLIRDDSPADPGSPAPAVAAAVGDSSSPFFRPLRDASPGSLAGSPEVSPAPPIEVDVFHDASAHSDDGIVSEGADGAAWAMECDLTADGDVGEQSSTQTVRFLSWFEDDQPPSHDDSLALGNARDGDGPGIASSPVDEDSELRRDDSVDRAPSEDLELPPRDRRRKHSYVATVPVRRGIVHNRFWSKRSKLEVIMDVMEKNLPFLREYDRLVIQEHFACIDAYLYRYFLTDVMQKEVFQVIFQLLSDLCALNPHVFPSIPHDYTDESVLRLIRKKRVRRELCEDPSLSYPPDGPSEESERELKGLLNCVHSFFASNVVSRYIRLEVNEVSQRIQRTLGKYDTHFLTDSVLGEMTTDLLQVLRSKDILARVHIAYEREKRRDAGSASSRFRSLIFRLVDLLHDESNPTCFSANRDCRQRILDYYELLTEYPRHSPSWYSGHLSRFAQYLCDLFGVPFSLDEKVDLVAEILACSDPVAAPSPARVFLSSSPFVIPRGDSLVLLDTLRGRIDSKRAEISSLLKRGRRRITLLPPRDREPVRSVLRALGNELLNLPPLFLSEHESLMNRFLAAIKGYPEFSNAIFQKEGSDATPAAGNPQAPTADWSADPRREFERLVDQAQTKYSGNARVAEILELRKRFLRQFPNEPPQRYSTQMELCRDRIERAIR